MNYPKISIITPSYNQGQYIEETILSIINQGYPNLEYIIIDGGSTDNTVDIIKKYEKHISYWVSEPDKGQSDAINKGIAVATGEVFNWINSDDMLLPGSLELVASYFKDSQTALLCTPIQLLHIDGSTSISGATNHTDTLYTLLLSSGLTQPGMYWNMDIIRNLNGVNTEFTYSMDLDLWKRFLLTYGKQHIHSDSTPTCIFRFHAESKTGGAFDDNYEKFALENNAALQQYASVVSKNYVQAVRLLFPLYKHSLAIQKPISSLPQQLIAEWLTQLYYKKVQKAFFAEDFAFAYKLAKLIDKQFLQADEIKNLKSYIRWSFIKSFI